MARFILTIFLACSGVSGVRHRTAAISALRSSSPAEDPVDLTADFNGNKKVFRYGSLFRCCCKANSDALTVACDLTNGTRKKKAATFASTFSSRCPAFKGENFHSWNNMPQRYRTFHNYGKCVTIDEDPLLPTFTGVTLEDVSPLFGGHQDLTLSNITYSCCCSINGSQITCGVSANHALQATCTGSGFYPWNMMPDRYRELANYRKCSLPLKSPMLALLKGEDQESSSSIFSFYPDAQSVAKVKRWLGVLGRSDDGIDWNSTNPAQLLRELAQQERLKADGKDEDRQVLMHLLEMHFYERHSVLQTTKTIFTNLAQDLDIYQNASTFSLDESHAFVNSSRVASKFAKTMSDYAIGMKSKRGRTKPLALIFTCSFGGGHLSASSAVQQYLDADGYDSKTVDTTRDHGFTSVSGAIGEHMFNQFILGRQNYAIFNVMDKTSQYFGVLTPACPSPECDNDRKVQFRSVMLRLRPTVIVTVYHMELLPVLELAKDLGNMPIVHVATDMDIKMKEIFDRQPIYPRMRVGVPFDLEDSWATIAPLQREQTFLSGYPVRDSFIRPRDESRIQSHKSSRYPEGATLILVMTGGGGQDVPWPELLAFNGLPGKKVHVVIVAGGNNDLEPKLGKQLTKRVSHHGKEFMSANVSNVTVEVARDPSNKREDKPFYVFGDELALLMDMSDLVITKPGGGSTAEVAYRGLPAVFDASNGLLHWEAFTVNEFEKLNRGIRITSTKPKVLQDICLAALKLGQDSVIAQEPDTGALMDTGAHVRKAVKDAMESQCIQCSLF